jgi:hypothetical protein
VYQGKDKTLALINSVINSSSIPGEWGGGTQKHLTEEILKDFWFGGIMSFYLNFRLQKSLDNLHQV